VIDENGNSLIRELSNPELIKLSPIIQTNRPYLQNFLEKTGDIYPPSSNGWYGRLIRGKEYSTYIVQEIIDSQQFWLTILDSTCKIMESHRIHQYETEILRMQGAWEQFADVLQFYDEKIRTLRKREVLDILEEPSLTWKELSDLTSDMPLPVITRGNSVRNTLQSLVPIEAYGEEYAEEILAFLAWTVRREIPDDDLVDFVESIGLLSIFRSLYVNHLKLVIDNKPIPSYLRLVRQAVQEGIKNGKSIEEEEARKSYVRLLFKMEKLAPDWRKDAIEIAKELSTSKNISLTLPRIRKTHKNMRMRFLMQIMGFSIRAYVQPDRVGLRNLVYLGAAHRWPHRHLAYSLSFNSESEGPLHLQSIVTPPKSVDIVKAALPRIKVMSWSGSSTNLQLFRETQASWTIKRNLILNSSSKKFSMKSLKKKIGNVYDNIIHHLNTKEAQIIDMVNSTVFYLTHLDLRKGQQYWRTTKEEAEKIITTLRNKGVVDVSYRFILGRNLLPATVLIEGKPESIASIINGLLFGCPTTRATISDDGRFAICNTRIPIESKKTIFEELPQRARENGIDLKSLSITAHRNYEGSLLQRIIKKDGSYDDDITHFLSQIRSLPKAEDT
jgi:hypothetical protein